MYGIQVCIQRYLMYVCLRYLVHLNVFVLIVFSALNVCSAFSVCNIFSVFSSLSVLKVFGVCFYCLECA